MSIGDHDDVRTGGYVHGQAYLTMRLRMLLTGTAAPDETAWADALKRLLAHIAAHPVPGTPDDRAREFAAAWGVTIAEPAAAQDERGEREIDAGNEIRMLDLDDDLLALVEGTETHVAGLMTGRIMDTAAPVPGSFVVLAARTVNDYDFAMDARIRFEDGEGPESIVLTMFGRRDGSNYDWKWADVSRRTPASPEVVDEQERIAAMLHVIEDDRLRSIADEGARARLERLTDHKDVKIVQTVRPEQVVLTGDDESVAFVMPVRLHVVASAEGQHIDLIYHGKVGKDGSDGRLHVASIASDL